MNAQQQAIARACQAGAESGDMSFPQILGALGEAGFESYSVDFRTGKGIYFLPDGDSLELALSADGAGVALPFDAAALRQAIHEAQTLAPGYSYRGFCAKAKAAGVAGYMVSLPGRRALYFGRTAETHVEMFPGSD